MALDFTVNEDIIEALKEAGPEPMFSGSFSVFGKPNGNAVIVLRLVGQDEDMKQEIPAFALKMILGAAEGKGPMAPFAKMFG